MWTYEFNCLFLQIVGSTYSATEEIALKEAEKPGCGFLHPYDHPEVWYGCYLATTN
jgi:threonine dehydratase